MTDKNARNQREALVLCKERLHDLGRSHYGCVGGSLAEIAATDKSGLAVIGRKGVSGKKRRGGGKPRPENRCKGIDCF
jgi:hypothetical protein